MPLTLILRKVEGLEDQLWQVVATGAPFHSPPESNQFTCCSTFSSYQLIHAVDVPMEVTVICWNFFFSELGTNPAIEAKINIVRAIN